MHILISWEGKETQKHEKSWVIGVEKPSIYIIRNLAYNQQFRESYWKRRIWNSLSWLLK